MAGLSLSMELVGPNAGKTLVIGGKHQFIQGRYQLQGNHDQIEYALNYLAHFGAYPVGTLQYRQAQEAYKIALALKENANGNDRSVHPGSGSGATAQVPVGNGPTGSGSAGVSTVRSEEPSGSTAGRARVLPSGSGQADAGVSDGESSEGTGLSGLDRLRIIVAKLDPSNDAHWTEAGLPSLDAIQEAYPGVTRADVNTVAPNFTRKESLAAAI